MRLYWRKHSVTRIDHNSRCPMHVFTKNRLLVAWCLALAVVAANVHAVGCGNQPPRNPTLDAAILQLGSTDTWRANDAYDALVMSGKPAIDPLLFVSLGTGRYVGTYCMSWSNEDTPIPTAPTVGHIALYIIECVIYSNLHPHQAPVLVLDAGPHKEPNLYGYRFGTPIHRGQLLNTLPYDMQTNVASFYLQWWQRNKDKTLDEMRRTDANPLAGTRYEWIGYTQEMDCATVQYRGTGMLACVTVTARKPVPSGEYCVVDISGGANATSYPVSYFTGTPEIKDEYRTTKILLRKIPAGSFMMGSPTNEMGRNSADSPLHKVTLTTPFYMGIFEVTQAQYVNVMGGSNHSAYPDATHPVEQVSWNDVRGGTWPGGVPSNSTFMGMLRVKTGLAFDLPTEAQWEYACRAGTTHALNNDTDLQDKVLDPNLEVLGRYFFSSGFPCQHASVGTYQANNWGVYDMHGNVREWCLDWYEKGYKGDATNPCGPASGSERALRGGGCIDYACFCRSASRVGWSPSDNWRGYGFRLCLSAGQ